VPHRTCYRPLFPPSAAQTSHRRAPFSTTKFPHRRPDSTTAPPFVPTVGTPQTSSPFSLTNDKLPPAGAALSISSGKPLAVCSRSVHDRSVHHHCSMDPTHVVCQLENKSKIQLIPKSCTEPPRFFENSNLTTIFEINSVPSSAILQSSPCNFKPL
jgi:hypothetical protein